MSHPIIEAAITASASEFHVGHDELMAPGRRRPIVFARQTACWVIRRRSSLSFPSIGRVFHQDHTTVMNAVRAVDMARDPLLRDGSRRVLATIDALHPRRHAPRHAMLGAMMTTEELHARIDSDFGYHSPSSDEIAAAHEQVRDLLARAAHELVDLCPDSRELDLALVKLEEAMFFANGVIARGQMLRA